MSEFKDKIVLVTGASQGIGLGIATETVLILSDPVNTTGKRIVHLPASWLRILGNQDTFLLVQ